MPSQPPLPPLLTSYLSSQPEASLTLISSILGATSNWLVLRYLYSALITSNSSNASLGLEESHDGAKKKVVLVSFLRGWEFWRAEAKRLGLDLARLSDKKQFAFVDGLSELFCPPQTANVAGSPPVNAGFPARTTLPLRGPPGDVPGRAPGHAVPAPKIDNVARNPAELGIAKKLHFSGRGTAALDALEKDIISVIEQLKAANDESEELLLIIDQPDFLLAATGASMGIGATEMSEWVMGLQQTVHSTALTLAADSPLIHNASVSGNQTATPVEGEHAAFAIGLAHRASAVMQLRTLETGAARDVSGVLRISRGGGLSGANGLDEKELLYYVQRDGGVKVFGRGES
ncbi:uncharacterized protein N7484_007378 [Penicillium longicatenatum]|uniref:uncharacterized protein n=1 Tax=Penicillium longicatenatum TaxID=1561947 RepID=UPI0025495AF9|nr:uncharacterized protein N7484_007378 [Penicillium longicatenatum]KAJ5639516.1 hypothetical protein N7484_007378 [Penicillium longicatenatum]